MGIRIKYVMRVSDKKGSELLFKDVLGKIVYLDRNEDEKKVLNHVSIGDIIPVWIITEKARFDFAKIMLGDLGVIDFISNIDTINMFKFKNFKNKNMTVVKFLNGIMKYDDNFKLWVNNGYSLPNNLEDIMMKLESKDNKNNLDIIFIEYIKVLGYLYDFNKTDKPTFVDGLGKKDTRTIEELIDGGMTEDELLSLYKKKKGEIPNDAEKLYNLLVKVNKSFVCNYGVRDFNYHIRHLSNEKGFELYGENEDGFKSFKVYFGDDEFDSITEVFSITSIWSKS